MVILILNNISPQKKRLLGTTIKKKLDFSIEQYFTVIVENRDNSRSVLKNDIQIKNYNHSETVSLAKNMKIAVIYLIDINCTPV